jgi:hypothetical protein
MSNTSSQMPGSKRGHSDIGTSANETVQETLASFLAVPQKLMLMNLEAATHAFNFMNQRMKAQAALWTNIGHFSDTSGAAEAQRAFLETVTKDYRDEMTELTDMARKNFASVTDAAASAPLPGFPAARSS